MIKHPHLIQALHAILDQPLGQWSLDLPRILFDWENQPIHGNWKKWQHIFDALPEGNHPWTCEDGVLRFTIDEHNSGLDNKLRQFMPWRKGPFQMGDVLIDTEWRSDYKWNRVSPHIADLQGKRVLDVGCGSGYHLYRMREAGAKFVMGIDPTALFFMQFLITQKMCAPEPIYYLPLGLEALPPSYGFDSVFSMGVFYHRRDPFEFLRQLHAQLLPGGQLVLETLVIEGDETTVLVPHDRYAQMRNVWFLPSQDALCLWLKRAGFNNIAVVDVDQTSTKEQRKTDWIEGHSLDSFLDANDPSITVEGLPAPVRAVFTATK